MAVLVTLASLVATLVGGIVALHARDKLHLILGLAAGVLLGVVAFDLLPEMFEQNTYSVLGVPAVMITFAAGFLALHIIERGTALHRGHEHEYDTHGHHYPTVGLLAATALIAHSFMDGLGIGLGFQAGTGIGAAVALAVVAHDFADGFNTFTITTLYGNARRRALTLLALDAVAPVLGATATLFIHVPRSALGLYLGFFAGFLLYIATGDILPEAHSRHPSRLTLAMTVLGMAFMFVVVGVAG
ncbi:MAG: ZIP family metal transporter [Actinocatenispora sp.]